MHRIGTTSDAAPPVAESADEYRRRLVLVHAMATDAECAQAGSLAARIHATGQAPLLLVGPDLVCFELGDIGWMKFLPGRVLLPHGAESTQTATRGATGTWKCVDGSLQVELDGQRWHIPRFEPDWHEPSAAHSRWQVLAQAFGVALVLAMLAAAFVPAPYLVMLPGRLIGGSELIRGSNELTPRDGGQLRFATVRPVSPTWLTLPYWWVRSLDSGRIIPSTYATGTKHRHDVVEPAGIVRERAGNNAIAAAAALADASLKVSGSGVYVSSASFWPGGPQAGEVIVEVDGTEVESMVDFWRVLGDAKPGERVPIVVRGGAQRVLWLRPDPSTATGFTIDETVDTKDLVVQGSELRLTRVSGVEGNSIGLAAAIQAYMLITRTDVLAGRDVVATGQVDAAGHVWSVGGTDIKTAMADSSGADVMLVPHADAAEASRLGPYERGPVVIGVETLAEAIEALRGDTPTSIPDVPDDVLFGPATRLESTLATQTARK